MALSSIERSISKGSFSMYLRTLCDKELYLSLFDKKDCVSAGVPYPLKSRPGVQLITKSGREFEREQYDELIEAVPGYVIAKSRGQDKIPIHEALSSISSAPCFILQPYTDPDEFRDFALANIGLNDAERSIIPRISGVRPDVLYVHGPIEGEYEILPDGSRRVITKDDQRLAISVIDLKNVVEANPSYSAEVCLYAFFFANWLASNGKEFQQRFFVSDKVYLWLHVEMPKFRNVVALKEGTDISKRVAALIEDLQDGLVDYSIFIPSVRKFFKEDIIRVVRKGDEHGWESLDYHVNTRCGSCDWLGHKNWLNPDDKKLFTENQNHYCIPAAETADHLSKMATLSKGATKILATAGLSKVQDLVDIAHDTTHFKAHTLLRKDKENIGKRAAAIHNSVYSIDSVNKIGGLAKGVNAQYFVIVNFDSGTGLITGISIRGSLNYPFGQKVPDRAGVDQTFSIFKEVAFVTPKNNELAEWAVLSSFISEFDRWIARSKEVFDLNAFGSVKTQILFWEQRQYQELCNAFGRHFLRIIESGERSYRAMTWLFPPDELMKHKQEVAPWIVFVKSTVETFVHLPTKFATTLLNTARHYGHESFGSVDVDWYYEEPLGNAIPRERIFDIWNAALGVIKMYGREVPIDQAIDKYKSVLRIHVRALNSIVAKLRNDLKGNLSGSAPGMELPIPSWTSKVAFDSKVWIQWSKISTATAKVQAREMFITSVNHLEASYEAIRLTKKLEKIHAMKFKFEVSEESTEAKLDEGTDFLVLGIVDIPGFPLLTARKLGLTDGEFIDIPLNRLIAVRLEKFDRVNKVAVIELRPRSYNFDSTVQALLNNKLIPIEDSHIYILSNLPYDDSKYTEELLEEIGTPECSVVDPRSIIAMGGRRPSNVKGTDHNTPVAKILWQANVLSESIVRPDSDLQALQNFTRQFRNGALNESQRSAIIECAKKSLSIVWGPPGTGKTDTLVSLLHGLVKESQNKSKTKKILISGPNYRTVEELFWRLVDSLNLDDSAKSELYFPYSKSRLPKALPTTRSHIKAHSFNFGSAETTILQESLLDVNRLTIVATTIHTVKNILALTEGDSKIKEIFDFIVLDESSQIEVSMAIRAFSMAKESCQVVVAGDQLQMPPITSVDPPKDAEYLVGSIQRYFVERFGITQQPLLINYRSNQQLVDFAKTLGYPQDLRAEQPAKTLRQIGNLNEIVKRLPDMLPKTDSYRELLDPSIVVTTLIHEDGVSSQANSVEAKLVSGIAYCLFHSMSSQLQVSDATDFPPYTLDNFFEKGIGIVTPHKAQKALVARELMSLFKEANPIKVYEAVDTVERFQGGQRQTIIVSYGVGDTDIIEGEEEFLLQMERTNVAVSRAQAKCIVLMPKSLAYHLPSDQKVAKTAKALKSYVEEFCKNRRVISIQIGADSRIGEIRWH